MDYNDIQQELKRGNLAEAFPAVRQKAANVGNWEVKDEVEREWETYQQMLQFMLNGVDDPDSPRIRENICNSLQLAVCRLRRMDRLNNNASEKYVSSRKELKAIPSFEALVNQLETVSEELAALQHDELVRDAVRQHRLEGLEQTHEATLLSLFNWTWTSDIWLNSDLEQANRIVASDNIGSEDKAVFISAVTLSVLEFVDASKVCFLLDSYLMDDELVSQRSLVGFVLVFHLFFDQLKDCVELQNRLTIYRDDATFIHEFYSTMMQLQFSCTTDRITSRMRNDIIPAIMQGRMKHTNKNKPIDMEELTKNGENPEWMNDAMVDRKMHEMAELQLDGADIYYSSFSMLKGHQFFSQMPHWFYPFSFNRFIIPDLQQVISGKNGRLMRLILNSSPFCNSDKYSLCFTFQQMGAMGGAAIEEQIKQQLDGENLDDLIKEAGSEKPKKADLRRQYIFDLYRFFYSYPYRQQFPNPFALLKEHPITPYSNAWMTKLLGGKHEDIAQYADFLMRKEFYEAALQVFGRLEMNEFDVQYASLWQKTGFCHQKLNHAQEAIHAYSIANTLKPNSKWTLSHLASLCLAEATKRNSRQLMKKAANLYLNLLEIEPENLRYLKNAAQATMHLAQEGEAQYDEAQRLLYKAHYLDETSTETKQALAWCLILNRQNDKAAKILQEMQEEAAPHPVAQIYQAFILLIDGHIREAYNQLSAILSEDNRQDITDKLNLLAHLGIIDPKKETLFTDALTLHLH